MNDSNSRCGCKTENNDATIVCCQVDAPDNGETQAILADAQDECVQTRARRNSEFAEPICINASQIYDSCRDRDCVNEQRVYLTREAQALVDRAINVKFKNAEIIWVFTDIEPLSFNRGYFSVDLKFFVRVTLEVFCGVCNPVIVHGLTTYDKRIILYGSEGNSKSFSSKFNPNENSEIVKTWEKINMPTVTVETVEPVALTARIEEEECCCDCGCGCDEEYSGNIFPEYICKCFDEELVTDDCVRKVLVTYGLFFIVRLERDIPLLIDAVDFCIPTRDALYPDRPQQRRKIRVHCSMKYVSRLMNFSRQDRQKKTGRLVVAINKNL